MRRRVVDHRWRADVGGSRRWHAARLHADETGKRRVRLRPQVRRGFRKTRATPGSASRCICRRSIACA